MKIRFLMHQVYGAGGGIITVVRNLGDELAKKHDVEVVSVVRDRDDAVRPMTDAVTVRPLADIRKSAMTGPTGWLKRQAVSRPSRLIPPSEPHYGWYSRYSDLMLSRYLRSLRDGVVVGMQPGVNIAISRHVRPSVVRVGQDHRPFVTRRGDLLDAMIEHLPGLDTFLTLTETDAGHYRRRLHDAVPIGAIHNATPAYDGPLSDQSRPVAIAAGHLTRDKGYDRLVDAWVEVHRRYPEWELRIFGEGVRKPQLAEQIDRLQLGDTVRLMGYSHNLLQEMASSSIFLLGSRVEGYSMAVMEAMACGLPVVAFDCPTGPRDMVEPGTDGFLVPNGDIDAMATAIGDAIELGPGRLAMGAAAAEVAKSRSQQVIAGQWESLFEKLAASK